MACERIMVQQETVLLHLSDIHFHQWSGGTHDLDTDLRNELERDAREMRKKFPCIHGILVTGDIAFSGQRKEYEIALDWLKSICAIVNCPSENVWTTPGNHDVDRDVIKKSQTIQMYHRELRSTVPDSIDVELRKWLIEDAEAGPLLFRPMQEYVEFASKFRCQVDHGTPYWQHILKLNDGLTLRIRGLTSTLVSDGLDNSAQYKLVVGNAQCMLLREDGVIYMTLCHHPPQWLLDQDAVDSALNTRAHIQLFGHKHSQRVEQINNTLRITAGAVHPERQESKWEPRYNYLALFVKNESGRRTLEVDVYPRTWKENDTEKGFSADFNSDGSDHRHFSLPLDPWTALPSPSPERVTAKEVTTSDFSASQGQTDTGGAVMDNARRLVYRFLTLPYHERIAIAQKLQLLEDEDKGIQDAEMFQRFFQRAKERVLLGELWNEVEAAHHVADKLAENPFAGR
jgi:hypothetical protein